MAHGIEILLIIVLWLFVLAPWLLRGQKRVRKTNEGFENTRVVYEGGSGEIRSRRRAQRFAAVSRRPPAEEPAEPTEDDILLEEETSAVSVASSELSDVSTPTSAAPNPAVAAETGERTDDAVLAADPDLAGAVADEAHETESDATDTPEASDTSAAGDDARDLRDAEGEVIVPEIEPELNVRVDGPDDIIDADVVDDAESYRTDEAYLTPADLLREPELSEEEREMAAYEPEPAPLDPDSDAPLTEEELRFAEVRSRRGGWDPVETQRRATDLYARRRRVVLVLLSVLLVALVVGFAAGGAWWFLPATVAGLTGLYLMALRSQVVKEQELQRRRVRQLRRTRQGVLNAADAELRIPRHLRRPGAVVLERDDESPDFEYLEWAAAEAAAGASDNVVDFRQRRAV